MPKIDFRTITVGDSADHEIESALFTPTVIYGDAPMVGDVDGASEMLRTQRPGNGCLTMRFIVSDFTFFALVWQQFDKLAAIVRALNDRPEPVHLLLTGRDVHEENRPIESLRALLGESFPDDFVAYPRDGNDVFHHTFGVRQIEAEDDCSERSAWNGLYRPDLLQTAASIEDGADLTAILPISGHRARRIVCSLAALLPAASLQAQSKQWINLQTNWRGSLWVCHAIPKTAGRMFKTTFGVS
jgi:hypothetical protein